MPFRWDISRPEALGKFGKVTDSDPPVAASDVEAESRYRTTYEGFQEALLACAARTIALAGDCDLVFVGRGPESLFDLLSGLLADTSWQKTPGERRLTLLRFSIGYTETAIARRKQPEALTAFRTYMDTLGLSPAKLLVRERSVALVDIICNGTTMHQLLQLIRDWAVEEQADWAAIRRKLRVVGIVNRYDDEPPRPRWLRRRDGFSGRPYSWRTGSDWVDDLLERGALCELAVASQLWDFIGNWQVKSTPAFSPDDWGRDKAARPHHEVYYRVGLRAARRIYEAGCAPETRERFAIFLAAETVAMRGAWFRRLVHEVRDSAV